MSGDSMGSNYFPVNGDHCKGLEQSRGFTLLEVLVALVIVATALAAAMRAVTSLTVNIGDIRENAEGGWSAENRITEIAITGEWPDIGTLSFSCPQGDRDYVCEQQVEQTPNPYFRRVEVLVRSTAHRDRVVARLSRIVSDEP